MHERSGEIRATGLGTKYRPALGSVATRNIVGGRTQGEAAPFPGNLRMEPQKPHTPKFAVAPAGVAFGTKGFGEGPARQGFVRGRRHDEASVPATATYTNAAPVSLEKIVPASPETSVEAAPATAQTEAPTRGFRGGSAISNEGISMRGGNIGHHPEAPARVAEPTPFIPSQGIGNENMAQPQQSAQHPHLPPGGVIR